MPSATGNVNNKYYALKRVVYIWIFLNTAVLFSSCFNIEDFSRISPFVTWLSVMLIENFYE